MRSMNCLPFVSTWGHPWFLVRSVLLIFLVFCVLLCFMFCLSSSCVLCAQCCQCLWIVFVLCPVYPMLSVSLDCLRPVSCVPNVVNVSGLSIRLSLTFTSDILMRLTSLLFIYKNTVFQL